MAATKDDVGGRVVTIVGLFVISVAYNPNLSEKL